MRAGAVETGSTMWRWVAIAAIGACVGIGVHLVRTVRDRDALRAMAAMGGSAPAVALDSLKQRVAEKDSVIASLTGAEVQVIDLTNYGSRDPLGRVFWDPQLGTWTMAVYAVRAPKPGQQFRLWLIPTNGSAIPLSAFHPDARGRALVYAKARLGRDALQRVVVAEEPDGSSPAGTPAAGSIILAGR